MSKPKLILWGCLLSMAAQAQPASTRCAPMNAHSLFSRPASDTLADLNDSVAPFLDHGMPRLQARAFGTRALPILARLLRDDSRRGKWHRVTNMIGFIGDTAYFDTLRAFIWDRFRGVIDYPTYMAINSAQGSLNAMATESPRILNYLEKTTDPSAWSKLLWNVPSYSRRRVAVGMTRASIEALGYTDSERAGEILRKLSEKPYDPWQVSPIRDALARNRKVRAVGFLRVWEAEDVDSH